MARGVFTTADNLRKTAVQVSSGDLTIAAWVYPVDIPTPMTIWGEFQASADNFAWFGITGAAKLELLFRNSTSHSLVSDVSVPTGQWSFVAARFEPGSFWSVFVGTTKKAAICVYNWPSGMTRTSVGFKWGIWPTQAFNGYVGPLALWGSKVADASIEAMAGQFDFRSQDAGNLNHYYEMIGAEGALDLIGSFDFDEIGTLPEQDGPVIRWGNQHGPWEYGFAGVAE